MASVVAATTAVAGHPPDTKEPVVAPLEQAALVLISIAPLFISVNTNVNVIATAALAVYVGCRRSVKDGDGRSEDVMTKAVRHNIRPPSTPPPDQVVRHLSSNSLRYIAANTETPSLFFAARGISAVELCWIVFLTHPFRCAQDALRFPLVGSAVLLGLFILFKFFNKDLVNALLTTYFVVRVHPLIRTTSWKSRL